MLQHIQTLHGVSDYETHENQFSITDVKPGSMHQNWHSDDLHYTFIKLYCILMVKHLR